jgi:LAO/AO transport system kinase
MWQQLLKDLQAGNIKALARTISLVENEVEGYEELLKTMPAVPDARIVGITGPPGAGKSTLADALIGEMVKAGKKWQCFVLTLLLPLTLVLYLATEYG